MTERLPSLGPERRRIEHEIFNLDDGPIDILLADHQLRIIVPQRDLPESWYTDHLVVDPNNFDPLRDQGYTILQDGKQVTLGRQYGYGDRFSFSPYVSRQHARLERAGSLVEVTDLNSTNGTYLLIPHKKLEENPWAVAWQTDEPSPEHDRTVAQLAGFSLPAERYASVNQDAYFIDDTGVSMGVFDGVGGLPGSERASELAAWAVSEYLKRVPANTPKPQAHAAMREALQFAHDTIVGDPFRKIATTATVAKYFAPEHDTPFVSVASAGDSRGYVLRSDKLTPLTLDQTFRPPGFSDEDAWRLQEILANVTDPSELDEQARDTFDNRNIITSYLGDKDRPPTITVSDFQVLAGDRILLTTDGVHDNLTNDEIKEIMTAGTVANTTARDLVGAARSRSQDWSHPRSKPDDMTAMVLDVQYK